MARKTATVTISEDGRDSGKTFFLREMPATQAEKWAIKALIALSKSGVDVPEDIAESGMAGIALIGLKALSGINFSDAEPLLDEMFQCIQLIPDPNRPQVMRGLIDDVSN